MELQEIRNKFNEAFGKYEFFEDGHYYECDHKRVGISTTGLIHQYSQEFKQDEMAGRVASKRGVDIITVLEEWRKENLHSTIKGNFIHEYAQSLWEEKKYEFDFSEVPKEIDLNRLKNELNIMKVQAENFYNDYKNIYELVGCEIYLGDEDFDECGATDIVFRNKLTGGIVVGDFKSNKEITYKSKYNQKMKVPLQKYDDVNYIHYSLQLCNYCYKITKNTGFTVEDKFIIYFNVKADNYEIILIENMEKEVKKILENRRVRKMNSVPVLIIGKSGSGKSASMRNFKKNEIAIVNVLGKPLPFKSDLNAPKCDDYKTILSAIEKTNKKTIVIDDANYLITNEFMSKSSVRGYDKYNELANNFWELIQGIKSIKGGKTVYLIMHEDVDDEGNVKPKTIGKLLDDKVNIQGMFTVCLRTIFENGNYIFRLKTNGQDCVKTPIGMFENDEMENDLKAVNDIVRDYYDLDKEEEKGDVENA